MFRTAVLKKIAPGTFFKQLSDACGVGTFYGVPDSLLKDFCAYVTDNTDARNHVITSNEGAAVAMGAGYHMATGKVPCIYMQNSGFGNSLNPLMSLTHEKVYNIPMLVLIGWRGDPAGKADEPQHRAQGDRMEAQLQSAELPYRVMDAASDTASILAEATEHFRKKGSPFAILIKRDTFEGYKLQNKHADIGELTREQAIEVVLDAVAEKDIVVSTTGMPSREVFEARARRKLGHHRDFLTVGSMGHASAIAAGVAISTPDRNVVVIDGDGSAIMHMGNLPINGMLTDSAGASLLPNLKHIVINNGAHDSVGGQPTVGGKRVGWITDVAKASGYAIAATPAISSSDIQKGIAAMQSEATLPSFLEIIVKKGNRKDIGRPTTTPIQNRNAFMHFVRTGQTPQ